MARCPNCHQRQSFWDTITLTKMSNRRICPSCQTVLEADKKVLSIFGGSFAVFFAILFRNHETLFDGNVPALLVTVTVSILVAFIVSYYLVILRVSKNQDTKGLKDQLDVKLRPELPENFTRKEYLKNRFYYKADSELENIIGDPARTQEAREAAYELLKERK